MIETKLSAYPLLTFDPLFSLWSSAENLYDDNVRMWTGAEKPIYGNIEIDGVCKRFMGTKGGEYILRQRKVEVGLNRTRYTFSDEIVTLTLTFTVPQFIKDAALTARPVGYIDVTVESADGKEHEIDAVIDFSEKIVCEDAKKLTRGGVLPYPQGKIGYIGRLLQKTIQNAGDFRETDWGWLYLAGDAEIIVSSEVAKRSYFRGGNFKEDKNYRKLLVSQKKGKVAPGKPLSWFLVVGYDDIFSVNYFGQYKKGYWTTANYSIVNAIQTAFAEHDETIRRCEQADALFETKLAAGYGNGYLTALYGSYRQAVAGVKIIGEDDGYVVLNKASSRGGFAADLSITYAAAPMILTFNPTFLKGMLKPLFEFARMKAWQFDFAPSDAGLYPYATGQIRGAAGRFIVRSSYFPFLKHICNRSDKNIYDPSELSPVDSTASMLILSAAYFNESGDFAFVRENADLMSGWADYLVEAGLAVGGCPSPFASLDIPPKDVNLAVKSIIAIAAWGLLRNEIQPGGGKPYLETAARLAKDLISVSDLGDRLALAVDDRKSWGLKYNLIWDRIFATHLFDDALIDREIAFYLTRLHKYGVALDNRSTETSAPFMMWTATLGGKTAVRACGVAIADMLANAPDRVPFPTVYDAVSAEATDFANAAVGGVWMPIYAGYAIGKKGFLKPL